MIILKLKSELKTSPKNAPPNAIASTFRDAVSPSHTTTMNRNTLQLLLSKYMVHNRIRTAKREN